MRLGPSVGTLTGSRLVHGPRMGGSLHTPCTARHRRVQQLCKTPTAPRRPVVQASSAPTHTWDEHGGRSEHAKTAAAVAAAELEQQQRQLSHQILSGQPPVRWAAVLDAYASMQHEYHKQIAEILDTPGCIKHLNGLQGLQTGDEQLINRRELQQHLLPDLASLFLLDAPTGEHTNAAMSLLQLALRIVLGDPHKPLPAASEVPAGFPSGISWQ